MTQSKLIRARTTNWAHVAIVDTGWYVPKLYKKRHFSLLCVYDTCNDMICWWLECFNRCFKYTIVWFQLSGVSIKKIMTVFSWGHNLALSNFWAQMWYFQHWPFIKMWHCGTMVTLVQMKAYLKTHCQGVILNIFSRCLREFGLISRIPQCALL